MLTPGFALPARHVIHGVGPVRRGGGRSEEDLLASAYESPFRIARTRGDRGAMAFPTISTGIYGFPRDRAARITLDAMLRHETELTRIVACLFDAESLAIHDRTLAELTAGTRAGSRRQPGGG